MYQFSEFIDVKYNTQEKRINSTMTRDIIDRCKITTKSKVAIFDDESTNIQFYRQCSTRWIHTINHVDM